MYALTDEEKASFDRLLNRGGYVLDFNTPDFDNFTTRSIGIPLVETYGQSKGKSLRAFMEDGNPAKVKKLLCDLLAHYEKYYLYEYNPNAERTALAIDHLRYDDDYKLWYERCCSYREAWTIGEMASNNVRDVASFFDSAFLRQETQQLWKLVETDPTKAIGGSKELIESCSKAILERMDIEVPRTNGRNESLSVALLKALKLHSSTLDGDADQTVLRLLKNIQDIPARIYELRNGHGSGHGKDESFEPLDPSYARLVVSCSAAFCQFVWSIFDNQLKHLSAVQKSNTNFGRK